MLRERACIVVLDGHRFAIDVREAREVIVLDALTSVPGAPASLLGVANLRGSVLGVVDPRPLLGLPPRAAAPGAPMLVIAAGDLQAAIPIDRVVGLHGFDAPRALEHPHRPGAAFAAGMIRHGDDEVTLLDVGRLLRALRATWLPPAPEVAA